MSLAFSRIIRPYFDYLKQHFQILADEVIKNNISAGDIARDFLSVSRRRDSFLPVADEVRQFIFEFWKANQKAVLELLPTLNGLKARFGGDVGPQANNNMIQRAGLYFDTLIVPDPIYRIARIVHESEMNWHYYLLKYAINQIITAESYLADIDPPIAVLVPDTHLLETEVGLPALIADGEIHTILAVNKLYGTQLDSFHEVEQFFERFSSLRNAVNAIQDSDLFWFDEDVERNPQDQLDSIVKFHSRDFDSSKLPFSIDDARFLPFMLKGRMMQVADVYRSAFENNALPLIPAPVSFHWFSFRFSIGQSLVSHELQIETVPNLVLTNALLSSRLDWLGNVPVKSLVQLRERGTLRDLRAVLAGSLAGFNSLSLSSITDATARIDSDISNALKKHQAEVQQLNSDLRAELAITVPTFLASVVASLQPTVLSLLPQWMPGLATIIGTGSVAEILRHSRAFYQKGKVLKESPIAILWNAKQKSET